MEINKYKITYYNDESILIYKKNNSIYKIEYFKVMLYNKVTYNCEYSENWMFRIKTKNSNKIYSLKRKNNKYLKWQKMSKKHLNIFNKLKEIYECNILLPNELLGNNKKEYGIFYAW